ncbi:MAG TPA: hypothetical protein VL917_00870 [Sphingomicrobium sp.]|nr:hypothetical protein [Sphingomicrobium sp.]
MVLYTDRRALCVRGAVVNSGLTIFAAGVMAVAAATAMVAPSAPAPSNEQVEEVRSRPPEAASPANLPVTPAPPRRAPMPGGMISHSKSSPAVSVRMSMPAPPVVAIPRIPGPADMMVATGEGGNVRTIESFASNEACDEALRVVRRTISNAFCVSTTLPPPPPEFGFLFVVDVEKNELVRLDTYPSMAACRQAMAAVAEKPGFKAGCTPKIH